MNDDDFTHLRQANKSFIGNADDFDAYRQWASEQICNGCGAAAKDRSRDENGKLQDLWATETCCVECWHKGKC